MADLFGIPLRHRVLVGGAENLSWSGLWSNLVSVTLSNIVGGGVMVALVYYFVYRHQADKLNHSPFRICKNCTFKFLVFSSRATG
jgi:formate/nitrite transporter FocA (FNT family)